jgi:hypothetical protein
MKGMGDLVLIQDKTSNNLLCLSKIRDMRPKGELPGMGADQCCTHPRQPKTAYQSQGVNMYTGSLPSQQTPLVDGKSSPLDIPYL